MTDERRVIELESQLGEEQCAHQMTREYVAALTTQVDALRGELAATKRAIDFVSRPLVLDRAESVAALATVTEAQQKRAEKAEAELSKLRKELDDTAQALTCPFDEGWTGTLAEWAKRCVRDHYVTIDEHVKAREDLTKLRAERDALRGALEKTSEALMYVLGGALVCPDVEERVRICQLAQAAATDVLYHTRALAPQSEPAGDLPCLVARPGEGTYECRVDNLCANCARRRASVAPEPPKPAGADAASGGGERRWHALPGPLPPAGLGVLVWRRERSSSYMACIAENGEWCGWGRGLLEPLGFEPSHWHHTPGEPSEVLPDEPVKVDR